MSSPLLSAAEVMKQLDALRKGVHDVATREQQSLTEMRTGISRLRQRLGRQREESEARLAEQTVVAEDDLRQERLTCNQRFEKRKTLVTRAHKAAKQFRAKHIETWEGNRKYETQKGLLQAERDQENRIKAADEAFHNFAGELAVEAQNLARLEEDAHHVFSGYGSLKKSLTEAASTPVAAGQDEHKCLEELRSTLGALGDKVKQSRRRVLPALFRGCPLWLMIFILVLVHAPLTFIMQKAGHAEFTYQHAGISFGVCVGLAVVMYVAGLVRSKSAARAIAVSIGQARQMYGAGEERSARRHSEEVTRAKDDYTKRTDALNDMWPKIAADVAHFHKHWEANVAERLERTVRRNERLHQLWLERRQQAFTDRVEKLKAEIQAERAAAEQNCANQEKLLAAKSEEDIRLLETEWKNNVIPVYETLARTAAEAAKLFPDWQESSAETWVAPTEFIHAARFGRMDVDAAALAGALPQDARLQLPGPAKFTVPLLLGIPHDGSLAIETRDAAGRDTAMRSLNNVILRLLTTMPPGKASFTIFDPVELGQSFAGLMHLTDYEARLINDRIWTQTVQIEQKLADLNEHIEKVTQMYLRNEYESITEYNIQAGRIAEKYNFLVVADFPNGFSDLAARRLLSIATSGARCGVYTLIHWDQRKPLPHDFVADQLRAVSICLRSRGDSFTVGDRVVEGTRVTLDTPAGSEVATALLHKVGQGSIDSNRVEMPFEEIAPDLAEVWTLDSASELRVPIGRTGATKLQYMGLGKGTRQHALLAGKTGSGKSTLFHVMITNLALWFSPEQVEFYLVDFKKGVEFKCYGSMRLPHARVVAVESDREFGLSVLQRVDDELKRRGDLFRKLGVQDVAGYRRSGCQEPLPRTLLLIDEFQEFFTEDDRVSQSAALLLDRIVRQGRAFGVHVLLGSQTLGGAYTLARTTLGQMVVRIALQCNEADAYLIMDEDNSAPRLLSRPGEAIYNDAAGAVEGNSPFQIVWLGEEEREILLKQIRDRADQAKVRLPAPVVFEGNAPSEIRENQLLADLLAAAALKPAAGPRVWLGAPNSIKGPTEAIFHHQSGHNLLVVGQRDEAVQAMQAISLICLAAQHARGTARFLIFDCTPPGADRDYLERAVSLVPRDARIVNNAEVDAVMAEVGEELGRRTDPEYAAKAPVMYLFIGGIQRFKKLRFDEDFEFSMDPSRATPPGNVLNKVICEGASLGIHVICTCDTANNLTRSLSRKAITEFEMRVLFQMSATDSATLIDSPKAGNLGLHRAIFSNGKEGYLETFRPYAAPDNGWLEQAGTQLKRLRDV